MANTNTAEMRRATRIVFGTIMGLLFGVFMVILFSRSGLFPAERSPTAQWLSPAGRIFVLLYLGVVGFAISISGLRMPWPLHGAALGLVFTIPVATWLMRVFAMFQPVSVWAGSRLFFLMLVLGIIFGLLTELVLSGVLRAPSAEPDGASKTSDKIEIKESK